MSDDLDIDYTTPAVLPDPGENTQLRERLSWHLRMARREERERDEERAVFDAEIARLTERRDELAATHDARIDWHLTPVREYHLALLREQGDDAPRSLRLPYGTSKLRVPKSRRIEFDGDDGRAAALEWVKANHPDHLSVSVNVTALRSIGAPAGADTDTVIDPMTGEVVPGVRMVLPEASWSIETEGEAL